MADIQAPVPVIEVENVQQVLRNLHNLTYPSIKLRWEHPRNYYNPNCGLNFYTWIDAVELEFYRRPLSKFS